MTKAEKLFIEAQREFKAEHYEKALDLHLRSAELGYAAAQSNVGYAYLHGKGTAQDYEKAVVWFEKAAAQDNAPAIINLGYCYTKGFGVPVDKREALDLFGRAAMLGSEQGKKNYERLQKELGIETPAEPEADTAADPIPESLPEHYPDAKKLVRKLIGADYTRVLIALAVLVVTFTASQLIGDGVSDILVVALWLVIVACFLVVMLGISSIPGYRNATKCLNRLEALGLLDKAVEEIKFGDPQPFGFSGCITKSFVYGNGAILAISDILWVYPHEENKFIALKIGSKAYPPMTLSGAAKNDRTGMIDKAIAELTSRNPNILSGNTPENKKAYNQSREQ